MPAAARADVLLGKGRVEGGAFGILLAISAKPVAEMLVRVGFFGEGNRHHDENSVDQLVAILFVVLLDLVELLRRHQGAGQFWAKNQLRRHNRGTHETASWWDGGIIAIRGAGRNAPLYWRRPSRTLGMVPMGDPGGCRGGAMRRLF